MDAVAPVVVRVGLFFFVRQASQRRQLASERTPLTRFAPLLINLLPSLRSFGAGHHHSWGKTKEGCARRTISRPGWSTLTAKTRQADHLEARLERSRATRPPCFRSFGARHHHSWGRPKRVGSSFLCAMLRSGGSLPLRGLRSLRSLRPLPSSSASSLRDTLLPTGPSPCPCPGVDTPLRGNCRPLRCALVHQGRCIF